MKFSEFYTSMVSFGVFSFEDARGVFGAFDRRRLHEWNQKGLIIKLIKGNYIFSDFIHVENIGLLISNKIYNPSYVSLEYVMSFEGLIPEAVYTITAVSTLKTSSFDTPLGAFDYRKVKNELFSGYELRPLKLFLNGRIIDRKVRVASLEKAFFDFIYLKNYTLQNNEIRELRFDRDVLKGMKKRAIKEFIAKTRHKTVEENIQKIWRVYDIKG